MTTTNREELINLRRIARAARLYVEAMRLHVEGPTTETEKGAREALQILVALVDVEAPHE